jgi:hypothetical protein
MADSPMQSIALVSTREAPEDGAAAPSDPPDEARPDRIPDPGELHGTCWHTACADAGLLCVHPEPDRGADVGLDLRPGRVVRQGGSPRVRRVRVRVRVRGGRWRGRAGGDGGGGGGWRTRTERDDGAGTRT